MQSWLSLLKPESGPKYAAIADALAGAIRSGELRPGERLPPQRDVAKALRVDLTTVTRAYGLVRQAGLIEGAGKLGSFVRNDALPPVFGETASEVGMNVPPQPGFTLLPEAINVGTATLLRAGRHSPILQYQPSLGNMRDRTRAVAIFEARGMPTLAEQIAITAGAQNALHGIFTTHFRQGDRICCALFIYPGMLGLAKRHGLQLLPIDTDEEGILPDRLDAGFRQGATAVYLTPINDNPTTATMNPDRRAAIADIARRHDAIIVEDDAYGLLPSTPLPPIAAIAPERSWHISGTSKVISPVIRVAHVRAPSAAHAQALAADISQTSVMAPPLNTALVSLWLSDGTFARLVAGVRAEAIARQRIAARCMAGCRYAAHPEGYHLWLDLPAHADAAEIVTRIAPLGLSIVSGQAFAVARESRTSHVRVSIGGAIDHGRLERALLRLADLLRD
jgi:DNA-binding transcriptional MocR family regulator